ncbi:uncharacterized protein LOC141654735 [Silene latifolia]|uniref:uncharacterized protein LOC141654735 n=1 Tax=Silene latifolia TaxID=37657 RepID=UPI003D776984
MGEEIVVEDYMLQEIDTWKYYLSKDEFEDTMLNFEDHKPKYITVGKPTEFVTIKRRVLEGTSCSSSACEESPDLCKKKQLSALHAIDEYYDRRGLKRKLGFAGLASNDGDARCLKRKIGFPGLGNDEDVRQCSRKETVVEDWGNLNILADACCSVAAVKPVIIRLKIIPPAVKPVERLKVISAAEIAKVTSRKTVKVKKTGNAGKTKKGSDDNRNFDVPVVTELPPEYLEKIKKLNGRNIQRIEEKPLTASDVRPNLCRLLLNQKNLVVKPKFLTDDEEKKIAKKDEYINAKLIEPMGCYQEIKVNKWHMNHNSYNTLLKPWKELAASNGFGENDVVQVWSFRFDDDKVRNQLGIAIVRIFTAPRESSTSGSSGDGNGSSSLCSS